MRGFYRFLILILHLGLFWILPRFASADSSDIKVSLSCAYQRMTKESYACDSSTWHGRALLKESTDCLKTVNSDFCQAIIKEEPELRDGLRKCSADAICTDGASQRDIEKACKEGFLIGTGETFVKMSELAQDAGSAAWNAAGAWYSDASARLKAHEERLRSCKDAKCKREKVKGLAAYDSWTDEQFNQVSAAFLDVEAQKIDYLKSEKRRSESRLLTPRDWVERAEQIETQRSKTPSSSSPSGPDPFQWAYQYVKQKNAKLQCFDARTQQILACWGVAMVVDPLLVAGAAAKGARMAQLAVREMSELKAISQSATTVARDVADDSRLFETVGRGDSRGFANSTIDIPLRLGRKTKGNLVPHLPDSMEVARYRNRFGDEFLALEKTVNTPNGKKLAVRELPVDPLTGTFDANFAPAREFMETIIKERQGKVTLAVIDVDNLGFVSNNFTRGAKGTPKELKAAARKVGDQYLKAVSEAIQDVVAKSAGGAGQLFRTGGDEFALILNETDPKKVQSLLDQINARVREKDVRKIFTEETAARAAAMKAESATTQGLSASAAQEFRLGYAPYSQPNVSIGSVVVNGESLERAFEIADQGVALQKLETKTNFAANTTKYGGAPPSPDAVPKLGFIPKNAPPAIGRKTKGVQTTPSPALSPRLPLATERRVAEKFRVGNASVVEYENEAGARFLNLETYFENTHGQREFVTRELIVNEKTGLIDARHERGHLLLKTYVNSERTPGRGFIWLNLEKLGAINYLPGGSKVGDQALRATADTLKMFASREGIPLKLEGSEFALVTENMTTLEVQGTVQKLRKAFSENRTLRSIYSNPQVQKAFKDQIASLKFQIDEASRAGKTELAQSLKAELDITVDASKNFVTVRGTHIMESDSLETVRFRTRGGRYPGED